MSNVFIFDYDGVLVDSFDIFVKYFLIACKREGIKEISTKKDFLAIYENNMYENMFALGMSKDQILNIVHFMKESIIAHKNDINCFPQIKQTIKSLSQNHILHIVTSSDTRLVSDFLTMFGLELYFDEIIGSDKEPSKTKKIIYLKQKYSGRDCFYIGDTAGDVIEGKKAGVKTIAVTWGWHDKERLKKENPDYLIDNPNQLLTISSKIIAE